MGNVKFRTFEWPENPEVFEIHSRMDPVYEVQQNGLVQFQKMGEVCRTVELRGVFHGPTAYESAMYLNLLMQEAKSGVLEYQNFGSWSMYMTRLELEEENRENCIAYSVVFRQVDSAGSVPPMRHLPDTGIR